MQPFPLLLATLLFSSCISSAPINNNDLGNSSRANDDDWVPSDSPNVSDWGNTVPINDSQWRMSGGVLDTPADKNPVGPWPVCSDHKAWEKMPLPGHRPNYKIWDAPPRPINPGPWSHKDRLVPWLKYGPGLMSRHGVKEKVHVRCYGDDQCTAVKPVGTRYKLRHDHCLTTNGFKPATAVIFKQPEHTGWLDDCCLLFYSDKHCTHGKSVAGFAVWNDTHCESMPAAWSAKVLCAIKKPDVSGIGWG